MVVSPPTNRYVFKPGEKITLTFRYRKAPNSEFIWFKCGRLDESKTRSLDPNNIDDIIVLVQINQDRTVRLVEFMPMEYNRRVDVISIGDGLNFIIDPLRASDQGRYICVLLVYDNDEFRTKSIRSTYVTLKSISFLLLISVSLLSLFKFHMFKIFYHGRKTSIIHRNCLL